MHFDIFERIFVCVFKLVVIFAIVCGSLVRSLHTDLQEIMNSVKESHKAQSFADSCNFQHLRMGVNVLVHFEVLAIIRPLEKGLESTLHFGRLLSSWECVLPLFSGCSGTCGLLVEFPFLTLTMVSVGFFPLAMIFFFFLLTPFNKASWLRTDSYSLCRLWGQFAGEMMLLHPLVVILFCKPFSDIKIFQHLPNPPPPPSFFLWTQAPIPVCTCSFSTRGSKIINNSSLRWSFMNHS